MDERLGQRAADDIELGNVVTIDDLARCLTRLRSRAGMPSLRLIERQTGQAADRPLRGSRLRSVRLGRTALSEVLHGRRFPEEAFLLTFVAACGIDLRTDHGWADAWHRLSVRYMNVPVAHETGIRQQIATIRARAERAEADNQQLRRQIATIRARAERAEADNQQLRQEIAVRVRPAHANPATGTPSELGELRRWDPRRIGPFALLGRLGGGAMGQVYLGRSATGRLVAVKTIKLELAENPGFRDYFAREVAAARRVSGMFTAAVVAADPEADIPWLATAYVPAPTLRQLVRSSGPLPMPTTWWLAAGCAEALESIHGAGLVHRDMKPSNVLVAPTGPLVIDFGVARAAERVQLTVTPGAVGTPAYMAPEQARDSRQASMASDVFGLGATILFAATGHAPYQGETIMDVLVRLATEPPDLSGLPDELTYLVTSCLDRTPRNRPTASALLSWLGPLVNAPPRPGSRHPFLADPAMAVITEFQRSPRGGSRDDGPPGTGSISMPSIR